MDDKYCKVNELIQQYEGDAKEWIAEYVLYMRENYPGLEEVISFQLPTYKLGSGKNRNYIAFGVGKNHFSLHTMDFDYIIKLKEKLKSPGKGKGCVNVKFTDKEEKVILFDAIQSIITRNGN